MIEEPPQIPIQKALKEILILKYGAEKYDFSYGHHEVLVEPARFLEDIKILKEQLGFIQFLDLCALDCMNLDVGHNNRFEVNYHLLNLETNERLRVKVPLKENEKIDSLVPIWSGAEWFEREAWDLMGIQFNGLPKKRLLTHKDFIGHPLQKNYDILNNQKLVEEDVLDFEKDLTLSYDETDSRHSVILGPSHPATKGTLKVALELKDKNIQRVKLEIGYLHRCFEKIAEERTYSQIIPFTDRLNYCSSSLNSIGWCKAVEDLMEIEIPDRAKALRMVFGELSRVADHLMCIGAMAVDLGISNGFWFGLEPRDKIFDLFEKYIGARVNHNSSRIGGLSTDLPIGWVTECIEVLKYLNKGISDIDKMLTRSKFWAERTKVCPVSSHQALDWGYSGPCLRACGVNYDLRKNASYYFYGDVDFEVPLGINGDAYDRYLVRMEEMRQSIKIVNQVLDNLPAGDIMVDDKRVQLPEKNNVYRNIDSLMNHFMIISGGIKPPVGKIYSATEAANGELGFFIVSDGTDKPYRVKVRPPCFSIFQSFPMVVKDAHLFDAVATLSSMNIVPGELDR